MGHTFVGYSVDDSYKITVTAPLTFRDLFGRTAKSNYGRSVIGAERNLLILCSIYKLDLGDSSNFSNQSITRMKQSPTELATFDIFPINIPVEAS